MVVWSMLGRVLDSFRVYVVEFFVYMMSMWYIAV